MLNFPPVSQSARQPTNSNRLPTTQTRDPYAQHRESVHGLMANHTDIQNIEAGLRTEAAGETLEFLCGPHLEPTRPHTNVADAANFPSWIQEFVNVNGLKIGSPLSPAELKQLTEHQNDYIALCQERRMIPDFTDHNLYHEVRRCLMRLNCLNLLKTGDRTSHQQFICHQLPHLSLGYESFKSLSDTINRQPAPAQAILRASTFAAPRYYWPKDRMPTSNISKNEFLAYAAQTSPKTLSVWEDMPASTQALLPKAYPPRTYLDRMLEFGGCNLVFSRLQELISQKELTDTDLDLWYTRSVIDLTVRHGLAHPRGSFYLDAPTAAGLKILMAEIHQARANPIHNIGDQYLLRRGQAMGTDYSKPLTISIICNHDWRSPSAIAERKASYSMYLPNDRTKLEERYKDKRLHGPLYW